MQCIIYIFGAIRLCLPDEPTDNMDLFKQKMTKSLREIIDLIKSLKGHCPGEYAAL
jgi:hypothetical protein